MIRTARLTAVALTCWLLQFSCDADASPRRLSGPEIKALFTDKTVHGTWDSSEYWSYFAPDGWTLYKSKGSPHQDGRWGASASQYCSKWPTSGESCYNIYLDGATVIWEEPQSGHRHPSELLPGKQVPAD
ncbi:MAG TPA: hypothetical protein VF920_10955 [Dongiaceae bacterium]